MDDARHFRMWTATVGKIANFGKYPFITLPRKQVIRFRFAQRLEPDAMVLAFFLVGPDHLVAFIDGDFSGRELELDDFPVGS